VNTEELYKRCHELFEVVDGELIRKIRTNNRVNIGDVAGTSTTGGYKRVNIARKLYLNHRLVFLMGNGYMPKYVDHINGNRSDDRLENLREISHGDNNRNGHKQVNCSSKYRGVVYDKSRNRWKAQANKNSKHVNIGRFHDEIFAANAVDVFNRKYNQEFATFNFPKENERSAL